MDNKLAAAGLTVTLLSGRQICFQAGWYRAFIASLQFIAGAFFIWLKSSLADTQGKF